MEKKYKKPQRTILCVSTDIDCRGYITSVINRHYQDCMLFLAANSADGMMCIDEFKPDIYVIDQDLIVNDYVEIVRRIQELSKLKDTILLSRFYGKDVLGAKCCIVKPVSQEILTKQLDTVILGMDPSEDRFNQARSAFFRS